MTRNSDLAFRWEVIAQGDEGPGVRSRHCFAHDHEARATVLVGGIIWQHGTLRSDTWELRDGAWHWLDCSPAPPARHRGAMVYDAARECCILFGGQGSSWEMLDDTWIYSNRRWRRWHGRWFTRGPAPRCGHSLAFDEAQVVVVLFWGILEGDLPLGDTWLFDGRKWHRVSGAAPA